MRNLSPEYYKQREKSDATMTDMIKKRHEDFEKSKNTPTAKMVRKLGLNRWDVLGTDKD